MRSAHFVTTLQKHARDALQVTSSRILIVLKPVKPADTITLPRLTAQRAHFVTPNAQLALVPLHPTASLARQEHISKNWESTANHAMLTALHALEQLNLIV